MNVSSADWGKPYSDWYDGQNFPTAATFRVADKVCLGFEDWPDGTSDTGVGADLNDLMFWVQGDFTEDVNELVKDQGVEQSWILAYEDLGNSLDWDYNDIVLKVSHVSGNENITITPLAAGGTLASHVKFYGKEIGEIHQLMGQEERASGAYTPINASDKGNPGNGIECNIADYYIDNVGDKSTEDDDNDGTTDALEGLIQNFSMTNLGEVDKMGGITLHVIPTDRNEEQAVISYTGPGNAPEVICLPGSWLWKEDSGAETITYRRTWRWPAELQHIDDAYPYFQGWAANKNTNKDWYKREPLRQYCVTGEFDEEVDESSAGGGGGDTESSGTTTYEGEDLDAIYNGQRYTIDPEVCKASTSCVIYITTANRGNNNNYTQLYLYSPDNWNSLIEEGDGHSPYGASQGTTTDTETVTTCTILTDCLDNIKKSGILIENQGTTVITKIVVIAK